jgi:hypothetical protein
MVKPLSGAMLCTPEFWAEVETAKPHRKDAARVRVSPIRLSSEVGERWVELLLRTAPLKDVKNVTFIKPP